MAVMPGYGESIRSVGVDYAGKAQPVDLDRSNATAKLGSAVLLASGQPLEWVVRRCAAPSGRRDDRGAPMGGPS